MQEQISANDARACVMVVMLLMIPVWWNVIRQLLGC
ncbi:hypothetical protein COPEUT_00499 [Coprococcus eutactus ATCC 27759]|nr:hypothetical protein COPEUT_00499 [Coprococcus eutactus ATCC 27759]